jgi:hypothetical protein
MELIGKPRQLLPTKTKYSQNLIAYKFVSLHCTGIVNLFFLILIYHIYLHAICPVKYKNINWLIVISIIIKLEKDYLNVPSPIYRIADNKNCLNSVSSNVVTWNQLPGVATLNQFPLSCPHLISRYRINVLEVRSILI